MENDFLDGIYWEEWYNKGNVPMEPIDGTDVKYIPCDKDRVGIKGPCPISPRDRMIMYSNRMLGVPRMRQIRVTNQSCLIPEDFKEAIKVTSILIWLSDAFMNLFHKLWPFFHPNLLLALISLTTIYSCQKCQKRVGEKQKQVNKIRETFLLADYTSQIGPYLLCN